MALTDVFERPFNKKYKKILYRASRYAQSAEQNDQQNILRSDIKTIGNTLFRDGDIINGGAVNIDKLTGAVKCEYAEVWINGYGLDVPQKNDLPNIPLDKKVFIGVRYKETEIDDTVDPELRNIAINSTSFGEQGAGRLLIDTVWGWASEDGLSKDTTATDNVFYPIFVVDNATVSLRNTSNSISNSTSTEIAKYDREANGNYIVEGLNLSFLQRDTTDPAHVQLVYNLTEGKSNINGYKFERRTSTKLTYEEDYELQTITNEPQTYLTSLSGRINLNKVPIKQVLSVSGVIQKNNINIVRGNTANGIDTLPDPTVSTVLQVKQGATTYTEGVDYIVQGDKINWATAGLEPSIGSTYQVTYQYIANVTPSAVDNTGFTVTGLVNNTQVQVTYSWKLPRIDLLALDSQGGISRIKGISIIKNPVAPVAPTTYLPIANITYDWFGNPAIEAVGVKTITVSELQKMRSNIDKLFEIAAQERLRTDAISKEPSSVRGLFVDPFFNDSNRDIGVTQNASIQRGELTLPIIPTIPAISSIENEKIQNLDYTLEAVISQEKESGGMKINPYQAFDPIPARVTLVQAVDNWTQTNEVWNSQLTQRFDIGGGRRQEVTSDTLDIQIIAQSKETAEYIRPQIVKFTVENFGPGELLNKILFDGVDVTPNPKPTANAQGIVTGQFSIPPGILAGSKSVVFQGAFTTGTATFISKGEITTVTRRAVRTVVVRHFDPLAQTFSLAENRIIAGVDLKFKVKGGNKDVYVQIRETEVGIPTQTVLSEGFIKASDIQTTIYQRCALPPVLLEAGKEYALVILTDDPLHELAIAELGKFDPLTGPITAQPYQVGVLLSSSNASTWTPHQTIDLKFKLLAAVFNPTQKTINLGTIAGTNVSDLIIYSGVDRPDASADVEFVVTDPNNTTYTLSELAPVIFSQKLTGDFNLALKLKGSSKFSPVVFPGTQLIFGEITNSATYISRYLSVGAATFNITVTYSETTPVGSSVTPTVESGTSGNFVALSLNSTTINEAGWTEKTYKASGLTSISVDRLSRLMLTLAGDASARPRVRNLRVIIS